jgi:hypothetical protein
MQMFCRIAWLPLIVVIRFVLEFFRKHVLGSWLRNRLQRMEGIAGGSIRRIEAEAALSEPLSPPPEKAFQAK